MEGVAQHVGTFGHFCLHVRLQVHILAEQFKMLFKRGAKLHSLLQPCVSVCCCVCAGWCNNLCSFPHYTVLHRSKWVLSMFLHLNYTTEIIGSGVAKEEEECRGSSSTELRDQTLSWWHLVTSSCLARCNMAITIYKSLVFFKITENKCVLIQRLGTTQW